MSYAPLFKPIPTTLSQDFKGLLSAFGVTEDEQISNLNMNAHEQISNLNMNAQPFTVPTTPTTAVTKEDGGPDAAKVTSAAEATKEESKEPTSVSPTSTDVVDNKE